MAFGKLCKYLLMVLELIHVHVQSQVLVEILLVVGHILVVVHILVVGHNLVVGHSLVVVEHNLDVIRNADWVIDLGPDAGDAGGEIVFEGTPEDLVKEGKTFTAKYLKEQWTQ